MAQQFVGMRTPVPLALAGGQVSDSAGRRIFRDYALGLADSTRRRQRSDLPTGPAWACVWAAWDAIIAPGAGSHGP